MQHQPATGIHAFGGGRGGVIGVQVEVESHLPGLDFLPRHLFQRGQGHLVVGRPEVFKDLPLAVALLRDLHRGRPGARLHLPDVHPQQPRTTPASAPPRDQEPRNHAEL
ncbi:hypothetical protein ACFFX0_30805 [Citricoccus parietis]|uniref:Uncharacterized protein n=1 Tax=Citricoccus parietis TaxID=592307 RepID=A0ABV5G8Q8_9MICC